MLIRRSAEKHGRNLLCTFPAGKLQQHGSISNSLIPKCLIQSSVPLQSETEAQRIWDDRIRQSSPRDRIHKWDDQNLAAVAKSLSLFAGYSAVLQACGAEHSKSCRREAELWCQDLLRSRLHQGPRLEMH